MDVGTGIAEEDGLCLRTLAFILEARDPGAFLELIRIEKISCDASIYGLGNIARRPEGADRMPGTEGQGGIVLGELYRWLGSLGRVAPLPDLQHQPILVEALNVTEVLLEHPADLMDVLSKPIRDSCGKHVFQALGVAGNSTFWGSMIEHAGDDDEEVLNRQREKAEQRASQKPATVGEGLKLGFSRAGDNIMEGLRGAVHRPLEGARKDGVSGFFKGVHSGALGLLAKPVAGVMAIGEHLNDRAGANSTRMRAPRPVYLDRVLRPFDATEAEICGWLLAKDERLVGAIKAEAQLPKKASSLRKQLEDDAKARADKSVSSLAFGGWGLGGGPASTSSAAGGGWGGLGSGLGGGGNLFAGLPTALGGTGAAASSTSDTQSAPPPELALVATSHRVTLTWATEAAAAAAAAVAAAAAAAAKEAAPTELPPPKGGWEVSFEDVAGVEVLCDGSLEVKSKNGTSFRALCADATEMAAFCERLDLVRA